MSSNRTGAFVWHDLMTTDPAAAIAFYTSITGWGTRDWGGPVPYTVLNAGETPLGGVSQLPSAAPASPHWLAYIAVPDVDATASDATQLGASTLVPPTDIPDVGRYAVLGDPQGATFAIYRSINESEPVATGPGAFSWHELATTDPAAAGTFYETLFGWPRTEALDMGEAGIYQMFGFDGIPFVGIYRMPEGMEGGPGWLHYIQVPDVDRAVEAITAGGGIVTNGPMEVPGGDRIAQAIDPQGAAFAVHAPASA